MNCHLHIMSSERSIRNNSCIYEYVLPLSHPIAVRDRRGLDRMDLQLLILKSFKKAQLSSYKKEIFL
jgi:hypothetical protein